MSEDLAEGTVTVLFTDVEGSTELRVERGDQAAHQILRAHEEVIRQQVSTHGGRGALVSWISFMGETMNLKF